jgi:hypothetical protein
LLEQPCVTFAEIATRFGVTRERVRQWHQQWLPEAPTGHTRQRLCARLRHRQALLSDPLVRSFFRHARATIAAGRIQPIRSHGGYRTRELLLDGQRVALRNLDSDTTAGRAADAFRYRGAAVFVFVRLGADEFTFFPAGGHARDERYRNTFAAIAHRSPAVPVPRSDSCENRPAR